MLFINVVIIITLADLICSIPNTVIVVNSHEEELYLFNFFFFYSVVLLQGSLTGYIEIIVDRLIWSSRTCFEPTLMGSCACIYARQPSIKSVPGCRLLGITATQGCHKLLTQYQGITLRPCLLHPHL